MTKALITIAFKTTLDLIKTLNQIAEANERDAQVSILQATEAKARSKFQSFQAILATDVRSTADPDE